MAAAAAVSTSESGRWFAAMAAPTETAAIAPAPQVVMVTTARLDSAAPAHRLAGTIRARTETDLGFRVGGKLLARPAEVGAEVEAGDVVATLDDTDLRLQLEAAEAARSAARIALEKGEIDLNRVTTLEKKGWASDQASDARTVDVEELRARLLQAERSVELAQNALSYATLRADAAGVVTETYAEAGQVLALGQPVVRIARDRRARGGGVGARGAGRRDRAAPAPRPSSGRSRAGAFPVELRELSPVADAATRTYEARFTLPADAAAGARDERDRDARAGGRGGRPWCCRPRR